MSKSFFKPHAPLLAVVGFMLAGASVADPPAPASAPSAAIAAPAPDGKARFEAICSGCHQATGAGVAGMYPPLAKRLSPWLATANGREYIGNIVLNGYFGTLKVDSVSYMGFMPTFGHLSSAEIAAILSYVGGTLNTPAEGYTPFTAAEIDALRAAPKRDTALKGLRDSLPVTLP
jgi:mono/diheme cytochrome c family protein